MRANNHFILRADNKVKAVWQIINEYKRISKRPVTNDIDANSLNTFSADAARKILLDLPRTTSKPREYLQIVVFLSERLLWNEEMNAIDVPKPGTIFI
ncbi:hypothetical protein HHI36_007573, partial [Cryptolaemus montrouzieri]